MFNYVRAVNVTHLVRAMSANASNQDNAPSVAETFHLPPSRLGREKSTVDVHAEDLRCQLQCGPTTHYQKAQAHVLELLRRVRQARDFGLREYPRSSNTRIHPPLPIPNHLPDLPHRFLYAFTKSFVALVNLLQKKKCTRLVRHVLADILERAHGVADLGPLFAWLFRKIDAVHLPRPRFRERQRQLEPDPAVRPGDERDAVGERELLREQSRVGRCEDIQHSRVRRE